MFELDPTLTPRATTAFGLDCAWTPEQLFLRGDELGNRDLILNALVNLIRKRPENLLAHVWRVFFCFRDQRSEPLYAALVDLLLTLNGRGLALAERLIAGSRAELSSEHYQTLLNYKQQPQQLPGNRYCLFTRGLIGTTDLFVGQSRTERKHDILQIAYDFIEYSQLDEAMDTLETGILEQPSHLELQKTLLEIYQSTRNHMRCEQFQQQLKAANIALIDEWQSVTNVLSS